MKTPFAELVEVEIQKARRKHGNMQCEHEAYAIILEELDEVWEEIKTQSNPLNRKERLLAELVQVAAMCRRAAEDLELL